MQYQEPNFDLLSDFQLCTFVQAPADCVLPDGFMCTTNFPTYVHTPKGWILAEQPRMDAHLVWMPDEQKVYTREFRCIRKGDWVAVAEKEDGSGNNDNEMRTRHEKTVLKRERRHDKTKKKERNENKTDNGFLNRHNYRDVVKADFVSYPN